MHLHGNASNVGTVNGKIYTAAPPPTVGCPTEGTATTVAIATQAASDALPHITILRPLRGQEAPIQARANSAD